MLEIKGLTKIYRSKTGEEVRALDCVNIAFPETGMVFILGKSGSGKSTLLNIMGGLDSYDNGEFVIKGKSSSDFAGSDFDAYRNTFIGFIFQEYNVLDDFTVGANIALALELQGKKASPEAIGNILEQVDLTSFAKRKPNELSGGQKQRVAIARALVKDPQIIMADEPTGALDSATGKQIFDTLKSLSKNKLVLVVSHDRDFAERYADRIVELSDGKIISDVTKHEHESEKVSSGIEKIGGKILRIKAGYTLTAEDLQMINAYLAENRDDILLSGDGRVNDELRSAAGISETGATAVFEATKADEDYSLKKYEKKDSHFIRSHLPIKNAVRIGSSGLKHKKFRLVMTIFLSLIAFSLFGFADTLAAYEKYSAAVESLYDSSLRNASFTLHVRETYIYGNGEEYISYNDDALNDADIEYLKSQTGLSFVPVFTGSRYGGSNGGFYVTDAMKNYASGSTVYGGKIQGLVAMSEEMLASVDLRADYGRLPAAQGEIAITELLYRQFNEYGFYDAVSDEEVKAGELTTAEDGSKNSIIGKHIYLRSDHGGTRTAFKIVGVVDTKFDYERYASFLPSDDNDRPGEEENMLAQIVLSMELESELGYGFHALGFAHTEDIKALAEDMPTYYKEIGEYMNVGSKNMSLSIDITRLSTPGSEGKDSNQYTINRVAGSDVLNRLNVIWLDGERTSLGQNEILLPVYYMEALIPTSFTLEIDYDEFNAFMTAKYGSAWTEDRGYFESVYEDVRSAAYRYYEGENYNYEQLESALRTDVFPFFLEKLGIALPDKDMTLSANFYSQLESILTQMQTEKGMMTAKIESYHINEMLRQLHADYTVAEQNLVKNDDFMRWVNDWFYGGDPGNITEAELAAAARDFYVNNYLTSSEFGYESNRYGLSGEEINSLARSIFLDNVQFDAEKINANVTFTLSTKEWREEGEVNTGMNTKNYTVVGFYESSKENGYYMDSIAISDTLLAEFKEWRTENMDEYDSIRETAEHDSGIWAYALAPMPKDKAVMQKLVDLSYVEDGVDLRFELQNYVMDTLDSFNEFIEIGAQVFLYVGLGFAVFSALLLMNFISTSISYKKREIGVLRAVGARSSDVFKIFFSEALIIALINFVCSTAVVIGGIFTANTVMHNEGITITLLSYGVRQFVLMLAVSIGVALIASFLPVNAIARKKPVDAIKDR